MSTPSQSPSLTPRHWDPGWAHVWVYRATESQPRRPVVALPENAPPERRSFAELYWQGSDHVTWDELDDAVTQGHDVALLPWRRDLVILDCDVKEYQADTGFVVTDGVARLAPTVTRFGIDDLAREVRRLGHDPTELATYAVRTKSGGCHLYYRACPDVPLETRHHRAEWRVDVIAGVNTWVAAPPTPGYHVLRDRSMIELPRWLAEFLRDLTEHLAPVGASRRTALERAARDQRRDLAAVLVNGEGQEVDEGAGLWRAWVNRELQLVALANQVGGWNQAIYQACRNLLDGGVDPVTVEESVLVAAAPVDARNERVARDTIRSAGTGHRRNENGERA